MSSPLSKQKCVPCEGSDKPLTRQEFEVYLPQVQEWQVKNDKLMSREFSFKDFAECLDFINKVGAIAQSEGHHPDINLHDFKKVDITLSTHKIGGLSVNDFILAVKINELV